MFLVYLERCNLLAWGPRAYSRGVSDWLLPTWTEKNVQELDSFRRGGCSDALDRIYSAVPIS